MLTNSSTEGFQPNLFGTDLLQQFDADFLFYERILAQQLKDKNKIYS